MGRSSSSYGKKTDKETQSPMLKIFKEIMQKEQHHNSKKDLEKATLVKEKRKKRKQYLSSHSKTKSEHRSGESSAAERPTGYKHPQHITQQVMDSDKVFSAARSPSLNKFPSEKRESWWLWGEANQPNNNQGCNPTCRGKTSTTRSCVSCQLKRILGNEYACIGCLIFVFTISVLVAFMVVFKTLTLPETELGKKDPIVKGTSDSKAMSDKLKLVGDYPRTTEDYRRLDFSRDIRRSVWGDTQPSNMDGSGLPELDFSESSFQNGDHLVGAGNAQTNDLASILDPKKFDDEKISPKIRKFYRKLIETDAQIKNLKKGLYENPSVVVTGNKRYRLKRSLFKNHKKTTKPNTKPETTTQSCSTAETTTERKTISTTIQNRVQNTLAKFTALFHFKHKNKNNDNKNKRLRRFENGTGIPAGFVFHQKQLIVQYHNKNPKFPKCSHAKELNVQPQGSTTKLKHPDRKDSKQVDKLLGQFMNKNVHKTTLDLYGLEALLSKQKTPEYKYEIKTHSTTASTLFTEHKTVPAGYLMKTVMPTLYPVSLYSKYLKPNVAKAKLLKTELQKYLKQDLSLPKRDYSLKSVMVHNNGDTDFEITTRNFDVALSVATLMNPSEDYQEGNKRCSSVMKDDTLFESDKIISKIPVRKLLLTEDEEESQEDELIGYEDFKEVLSDDKATHDENDRQVEKRKRRDDSKDTKLEDVTSKPIKYIPPGVYNPNWKGPVPLYPDEISSMMRHTIDSSNPTPPTILQMSSPGVTNSKRNVGDMQYMDTYLSNKYQKLANLAQAYSDYGVLNGMNDNSKNIKTQDKADRKMITTTEKMYRFKRRSQDCRSRATEGLSVQFKPGCGQMPCDDDPAEFMRSISKHLRIGKPFTTERQPQDHITLIPLTPDFDVVYNPAHHLQYKKTQPKPIEKEYDYSYAFRKIRSSLVSPNLESTYDEDTQVDPKFITTQYDDVEPTTSVSSSKTSPFDNMVYKSTMNLKLKYIFNNKTKRLALDVDSLQKKTKDKRDIKLENTTDTANITKDNLQRENEAKAVTGEFRQNVKKETIKQSNKTKNKGMGPDDFFALMSDWFSKLSNLSEANVTGNINSETMPSDFVNITSANKAKDLAYPMYDSDMIDNIGHRSRVLLSIEEDHTNFSEKADGENVSDNSADINNSTEATSVNFTRTVNETKRDVNTQSDSLEKDNKLEENKTVFKRSAPDSLVFWDDIYDDEYGIKLDPLDESKSETKAIDSSRKSAGWLQNKMRKMTDSIKKRSKDSFNKIYRPSKKDNWNIDDIGNNLEDVFHKIVKRDDLSNTKKDNLEKKRNFAFLTAHMKEVCKQASQAVQQTRSIRPRQDHESEMASGLMQQLVKLMSDLVDFEVEQRTCLKLPADLKGFLEWLTNPPKLEPRKNVQILSEEKEPIDMATTQSSEKEEGKADVRSECLGTLHAVENLMQEYTQLSDEDKNKMSGVKEYLEDQLDFLNKQISSIDETTNLANIYLKNVVPFRYRRDANNLKDVDSKRIRHRNNFPNGRRAKRKFLKSYFMKHTRTTSSNFESLLVTEVHKQKDAETNHNTDTENSNGNNIQELTKDAKQNHANFDHNDREVNIDPPAEEKTKRNLQDVYYKAVADAKKMTTGKEMQTKEFEDFKDSGVKMKA